MEITEDEAVHLDEIFGPERSLPEGGELLREYEVGHPGRLLTYIRDTDLWLSHSLWVNSGDKWFGSKEEFIKSRDKLLHNIKTIREWQTKAAMIDYRVLSKKSQPETDPKIQEIPLSSYPETAFLTFLHGDEDKVYLPVIELIKNLLENPGDTGVDYLGFVDSAHDHAREKQSRLAYDFVDLNREFTHYYIQRLLKWFYPLAAKYRELFEEKEFRKVRNVVTFHEDVENPDDINPERKPKDRVTSGYYAYFVHPEGLEGSILEKKVLHLHQDFVNNFLRQEIPPFQIYKGPDDKQLGNNRPEEGIVMTEVFKDGTGIDSTIENYLVYRGLVAPDKCSVQNSLVIEIPRFELVDGKYEPMTQVRRDRLMSLVETHFLRPYLKLVNEG